MTAVMTTNATRLGAFCALAGTQPRCLNVQRERDLFLSNSLPVEALVHQNACEFYACMTGIFRLVGKMKRKGKQGRIIVWTRNINTVRWLNNIHKYHPGTGNQGPFKAAVAAYKTHIIQCPEFPVYAIAARMHPDLSDADKQPAWLDQYPEAIADWQLKDTEKALRMTKKWARAKLESIGGNLSSIL